MRNKQLFFFFISILSINLNARDIGSYVNSTDYSIIPLVQKKAVDRIVHKYIFTHPEYTKELIQRSYLYFPIIEHMLDEAGMPEELKYIVAVESEFRMKARSPYGAVGLWQLVPRTARYLDLRVDSEVDERMDAYASTRAALTYLQDLYDDFGNWGLALAAYNCGPTRLKKAVRTRERDGYDFVAVLPKETQAYYDKFRAIKFIFENHEAFGIHPDIPAVEDLFTKRIDFPKGKNLKTLASNFGVDLKTMVQLNPHIIGAGRVVRDSIGLVVPFWVQPTLGHQNNSTENRKRESARVLTRSFQSIHPATRSKVLNELGLLSGFYELFAQESNVDHVFLIPDYLYNRIDMIVYPAIADHLSASELYVEGSEVADELNDKDFREGYFKNFTDYIWGVEDTLYSVAARHGVQVEDLMAANEGINFRTGRVIKVPLSL